MLRVTGTEGEKITEAGMVGEGGGERRENLRRK